MKQQLFALSLFAIAKLCSATSDYSSDYEEESSRNCDYSCCIPEQNGCIDCICFTPQFYDLQCDCGIFFSVDFLYWYAEETNLAYALEIEAMEQEITNVFFLTPKSRKYFHTNWDPGFRIGLGWNTACDGWDIYTHWTYYQNKKRNSSSVENFFFERGSQVSFIFPDIGQSALINPWTNADFSTLTFNKISAKWRFYLNSIDLELGRKYWLSKCFALRPYAALRGAWTKVRFNTFSFLNNAAPNGASALAQFKDRFKNTYWGVGFLTGLQPTWYFASCFALFGNIDFALIAGELKNNKRERYFFETFSDPSTSVINADFTNHFHDEFFAFQPIVDLAIGVRFERTWCNNRYQS